MKLLLILLLVSTTASSQTIGFSFKGDTLMYVAEPGGDTIRINKTRNAINNIYSGSAGTVYTLTATSAKVTFGTTSPSITFIEAGTYKVTYEVTTNYTGATFASARVVTYKLRRTNNNAADLTNSSKAFNTDVTTTKTGTMPIVTHSLFYTAAKGDIIELWGSVSVLPTAGSAQVAEASILVSKQY
jgi:hypothetical protein